MKYFQALSIAVLLTACKGNKPATQENSAMERANRAATDLATTLRTRLQAAMREGGPPAAIEVCATQAGSIAVDLAQRHNVRVGRTSTKLRNPGNTAPEWVTSWLGQNNAAAPGSLQPFSRVEGTSARVLRPIMIEQVCLNCHGDPATLSPAVRQVLSSRYPTDQATGYSVGQLRGVLWAEANL